VRSVFVAFLALSLGLLAPVPVAVAGEKGGDTDGKGDHRGKPRPTACFAQSPESPIAGESVTLDGSCSSSDGGPISAYLWDLDADGKYDDATGRITTASWSTAGTYEVGLRVVDDEKKASVRRFFTVNEPPPPPPPAPAQPRWLSPFPVVRVKGVATRRGARLSHLSVSAPNDSLITVICRGRNCPQRPLRKQVVTKAGSTTRTITFKSMKRFLPVGVRVTVSVRGNGMVGKYTRLRIRRLAVPVRLDRCLVPGTRRPVVCPPGP
jgi:hypothetical protein